MSDKIYKRQNMIPLETTELIPTARNLKADGYRLVQICATKVEDGIEILYSFDKDHELFNYKLKISEGEEVQSITGEYWCAFIYENEMHDLFGIDIKHMALDYGGKFFKVSQETPWNPKS